MKKTLKSLFLALALAMPSGLWAQSPELAVDGAYTTLVKTLCDDGACLASSADTNAGCESESYTFTVPQGKEKVVGDFFKALAMKTGADIASRTCAADAGKADTVCVRYGTDGKVVLTGGTGGLGYGLKLLGTDHDKAARRVYATEWRGTGAGARITVYRITAPDVRLLDGKSGWLDGSDLLVKLNDLALALRNSNTQSMESGKRDALQTALVNKVIGLCRLYGGVLTDADRTAAAEAVSGMINYPGSVNLRRMMIHAADMIGMGK